MNFLNHSWSQKHLSLGTSSQAQLSEKLPVLIKNPETKQIMVPFPLITLGRGYASVSTGSGPKWIPGKTVKPYVMSPDSTPTQVTEKQQEAQQVKLEQLGEGRRERNVIPSHLPTTWRLMTQLKNITLNF